MSFGAPGYLLFLLLAVPAYAVTVWWLIWRARARSRFGGLRVERGAASYAAPAAVLLAIAVAAFAAARPQWGSHPVQGSDRGIDVAIVLDVSNSMLAGDTRPTRLARAQSEIESLIERMQGDRVGIVVFAKQPFVRSPLTADLSALHTILAGIDSERGVVDPGSDLGAAIAAGQRLLKGGSAETKVMLIVSDGEDHGTSVIPSVAGARAAGIRIYTAGAGTLAGAPIMDRDPGTHELAPRTDPSGNAVVTHLDEQAMRRIAGDGGGRYVALSGDGHPLTGLASEFASLKATTFAAPTGSSHVERFQLFGALALLLVIGAMVVPPLLRDRRATLRAAARLWPLAGAGLLIGGICSTSVAELNRHGNEDYRVGQYDAALGQYHTAEARDPSRGALYYNAGNALDGKGDYNGAVQETQRALPLARDLAARIEYALGNHYASAQQLADAVEAYKRALLADPNDADAKHNLELITSHLTPTATPTATAPARTPAPGDDRSGNSGQGRPGPGQNGGTPQLGGTPSPGDRTLSSIQMELDNAIGALNQDPNDENAQHVLDLIAELNRRSFEQSSNNSPGSPPDY